MGIIKLGEKTYYLSGHNNIGIVQIAESKVWLIDSGASSEEGEYILKTMEERKWFVEGIAVTHYHADHCGGCAYIQSKTGCKVCGDKTTEAISKSPMVGPTMIYGGYPPVGLRHKAYKAEPFEACDLTNLPKEISPYDLSGGHCIEMTGYKTPDQVVFVGDATISDQVLASDGLIYIYNPDKFLQVLEKMEKDFEGWTVVSAHSKPTKEIKIFNQPVKERMNELIEFVFQSCIKPITKEALIQKTLDHFHCGSSLGSYYTMSDTVMGALSYLMDAGRMAFKFDGNVHTCESIESFYAGQLF